MSDKSKIYGHQHEKPMPFEEAVRCDLERPKAWAEGDTQTQTCRMCEGAEGQARMI